MKNLEACNAPKLKGINVFVGSWYQYNKGLWSQT